MFLLNSNVESNYVSGTSLNQDNLRKIQKNTEK
jgi:hypothetical protein